MSSAERYPEIDLVRGLALVLMIVYHTLFDLNFFSVLSIDVYTGFWRFFAFATAALFLVVVGVSLTVSRVRAEQYLDARSLAIKFVLRGAKIICLGLLVTLVTWVFLREGFVVFGILSIIGVSVLCSPLFFRFGKKNAIVGLACIATGWYVATITGPVWLVPFGIHPDTFWSVDYTPIFPWLGVVLIGIALGDILYPGGRRAFSLPSLPATAIAPFTFLGRHSLVIYLVHQPVILAIIFLVTGAPVL